MKKLLFFSLLIYIFIGICYSQSIIVTSPKGGENWKIGDTNDITWTSSGVTGDVTLKLYRGGTDLGRISANAIPASDGTYSWSIAATLPNGNPVTVGSNYQVMVRSTATVNGLSNGNFTIALNINPNVLFRKPKIIMRQPSQTVELELKNLYGGTLIKKAGGRFFIYFGESPLGSRRRPLTTAIGPVLMGKQMEKLDPPRYKSNPGRYLYRKYTKFNLYSNYYVFEFMKDPNRLVFDIRLGGGFTVTTFWILTSNGSVYAQQDFKNYGNSGSIRLTFNLGMDHQRDAITMTADKVDISFQHGYTSGWPEFIQRMQDTIKGWLLSPGLKSQARDIITQAIYNKIGTNKRITDFKIKDFNKLVVYYKAF